MWHKVSLFKFQQIEAISARKIEDIDKTLFSTCVLFNLTEYQLDQMPVKKASKLINRVNKIFASPFTPKAVKRIGRYLITYDISTLTFGQYIELSYFLSISPLHSGHYILATTSRLPFFKNKTDDHRAKSEYFLKQPITKVMGSITSIIDGYTKFNKEYTSLFGLHKETEEGIKEDKFNKRYGWIYSASQVAEYERITLNQAFELPVRQAFNDLAYLKAKALYETEQLKKK